MDASTETSKTTKGRRNRDKQKAVVSAEPVKARIGHLIKLHKAHATAADELNEAIKAVAEKSGLLASVVRKYVTARAGEQYEEKERGVQQLAFLFEQPQ